jgi:hypothetical protein
MSGAIPLLPIHVSTKVLSGAEVKNQWSYTSASPICLHSTSYLVQRLGMSGALPLLPLYVYTKRLIWCRGWEWVELYLYFPYMSPLSVSSGANVKNEWSYTSSPTVGFRGVDMDNFTVFLLQCSPRNCFLTPLFSVVQIPVPCLNDRLVPEMCGLMIIRYHMPLP